MKIQHITCNNKSYIIGTNIPKASNIIKNSEQSNVSEINAESIANTFKKFKDDFRSIMETFVYMIKH